jgi:hypothetical protein
MTIYIWKNKNNKKDMMNVTYIALMIMKIIYVILEAQIIYKED